MLDFCFLDRKNFVLLDGWVLVCGFWERWSVYGEDDDGGEVQGDLEGLVVFWRGFGVRP